LPVKKEHLSFNNFIVKLMYKNLLKRIIDFHSVLHYYCLMSLYLMTTEFTLKIDRLID